MNLAAAAISSVLMTAINDRGIRIRVHTIGVGVPFSGSNRDDGLTDFQRC
nr:hypothetical protein [Mycobacterium uberis]